MWAEDAPNDQDSRACMVTFFPDFQINKKEEVLGNYIKSKAMGSFSNHMNYGGGIGSTHTYLLR